MRHPRELGAPEVTAFLSMLANEWRKVCTDTGLTMCADAQANLMPRCNLSSYK